ncbi:hypothetical protein CRG98_025352, partial [Punica granatum]
PRCTRRRVGDVAVGVARLSLKLRVGDSGGGQPRQLGKNGVGMLAPTTARCGVGLVGLLRSRSRCPWADPNMPSPGRIGNSEKKLGMNPNDPVRKKMMKRWLCTMDRPSDRDHLFTGEGEGCEEPFERDGTTR